MCMCIVEQGCTHLIRPFVFTIHLLKCLHVMLSLEKVIHWKRPIDWLKVVAHWLYVCVCVGGGGIVRKDFWYSIKKRKWCWFVLLNLDEKWKFRLLPQCFCKLRLPAENLYIHPSIHFRVLRLFSPTFLLHFESPLGEFLIKAGLCYLPRQLVSLTC